MWDNLLHRVGILWGRYLGWQHNRTTRRRAKRWKFEAQDD